jgi:hypothetical protein
MDDLFSPLKPSEVSGNLFSALEQPAISENLVDEYLEILSPPPTQVETEVTQ